LSKKRRSAPFTLNMRAAIFLSLAVWKMLEMVNSAWLVLVERPLMPVMFRWPASGPIR
jgi:hypothetical protein